MIRMRGQSPISIACRVREKTPEMSACEAMMVASAASNHQRNERTARRQLVEWTVDRGWIGQNQPALAKIVQQQRRQNQAEPGPADRLGPTWPMSA